MAGYHRRGESGVGRPSDSVDLGGVEGTPRPGTGLLDWVLTYQSEEATKRLKPRSNSTNLQLVKVPMLTT